MISKLRDVDDAAVWCLSTVHTEYAFGNARKMEMQKLFNKGIVVSTCLPTTVDIDHVHIDGRARPYHLSGSRQSCLANSTNSKQIPFRHPTDRRPSSSSTIWPKQKTGTIEPMQWQWQQ